MYQQHPIAQKSKHSWNSPTSIVSAIWAALFPGLYTKGEPGIFSYMSMI